MADHALRCRASLLRCATLDVMKKLLVVVAIIGCGGDGETKPPNPDAPVLGGTCSEGNDQCSGETICVASSCVIAFPRAYNVSAVRVVVGTKDPTGADWDIGGGAPDLLVSISVNGAVSTTTPAVQDMFTAMFAGPFQVQMTGGANFRFDVADEDVSVNDPAFACAANPVTADLLRSRRISCTGTGPTAGYSLTANITPR